VIKLNKKTMYIIVAVLVIVIVIAGVAVYLLSNNGNNGTTNPTPSPTPTTNGVATASTLTYSANVTNAGQTTEYKWSGKDIHGNNIVIRTDFDVYSYILDSSQQKSWSSADSSATWTAGVYADDWPFWHDQWSQNVDALVSHWSGSGDYTYTDTLGETVTLFNIVVNPTIPDSTFTTAK
jgi:hypothetical protein